MGKTEEAGGISANKKKIFIIASSFITAIFNTIVLLYIARNMGVEILGAFGFVISFVGLASFVGDLGYAHSFHLVLEKGYPFSRCFTAYRNARIRLTMLMIVVASVLVILYQFFLAPADYSHVHASHMVVFIGYLACVNLAQIWIIGLSSKGREGGARTFEMTEAFVKFFMIIALVQMGMTAGGQEDVFGLVFVWLAASIMGLMITINNGRKLRIKNPGDEVILELSDNSVKLLPFIAFTGIILHLDKVLLWYWQDLEAVGLYFGGQRIVIFIAASSAAIGTILGKALLRFQEDKTQMGESLKMTERYITLMALPVTAFYIILAPELLNQFLGEDFIPAGDAVIMLAASGLFIALASPSLFYLVQTENSRDLGLVSGFALAVNGALCFALIPDDFLIPSIEWIHGINGAGIAILASSIIAFLGYRLITYRELKHAPHPRILLHLLAAGVMVVVVKFIIWYFDIVIEWYHILLFAIGCAFIYGLMMYLTGEFLRKDFNRFKELVMED